jgi:hypothetical protein
MIRVTVCIGARRCSQTAAATRPYANPATCDASAAAKVTLTRTAKSSAVSSIGAL